MVLKPKINLAFFYFFMVESWTHFFFHITSFTASNNSMPLLVRNTPSLKFRILSTELLLSSAFTI